MIFSKKQYTNTALIVAGFVLVILTGCTASSPQWQLVNRIALELDEGETRWGIGISNDGEYMGVITNYGVHLYALPEFDELWFVEGDVNSVAFSQGTNMLAVSIENMILLLDADSGEVLTTITDGLGQAQTVQSLSFNSQGTLLAGVPTGDPVTFSFATFVWDVETGENRLVLVPEEVAEAVEGTGWSIITLVFSPIDDTVAAGLFGSEIITWDAATGERLVSMQELDSAFGTIDYIQWLSDGSLLVGHRGGIISNWDPISGDLLSSFPIEIDIPSPTMSAKTNGEQIAYVDSDWNVRMLDRNGNLVQMIMVEEDYEWPLRIAFLPNDGSLIGIASNGEVYVWQYE